MVWEVLEVWVIREVWVVWVVWVVRLVEKRQLAPYIPNKAHILTMPQAAGKKEFICREVL